MTHRHLIILANPAPASFDHALAAAYEETVRAAGQDIAVRDLYAMGFDPLLKASERATAGPVKLAADVETELAALDTADILVLIYPIWFGAAPAILKGYVDRVFGANYSYRDMYDRPGQVHLKGKRMLSITTSGTPLGWLEERGQVKALRTAFDVYLQRGFGLRDLGHVTIDAVIPNMSSNYAKQQIDRVREVARQACQALVSTE